MISPETRFRWIRTGLLATQGPRYRRFLSALENPEAAQDAALARITRAMAGTLYGRDHGLQGDEDYRRFRARLPLVDYAKLAPWVEAQKTSAERVLAPAPVKLFEKTSGSSGRAKYIPYTADFLDDCDHLFRLWTYDLLAHGPRLERGRTYFSISPPFRDETSTDAGTPVGLDDDSEYLSPAMRWLAGPMLVGSPELKTRRDPFEYRLALVKLLVSARDLEVISIWSPTYLTALLEFIREHRARVAEGLPADRRCFLRAEDIDWRRIWPELKLISCWTDGSAGFFAEALREQLPWARLQGKGLLATEAPVTLPLEAAPAPVPLVDRVFLEFEDAHGEVLRLHELENGGEYRLIITQSAGLCRYRLGDRVRVAGRFQNTPCLRFVGREADAVSDLTGEKLNEAFVAGALSRVRAGFAFLVPVRRRDEASHYLCYFDGPPEDAASFAERLEQELQGAFHYRQARLLGQLGPVRARALSRASERYERFFCELRGLKLGDLKPSVLVGAPEVAESLAAHLTLGGS